MVDLSTLALFSIAALALTVLRSQGMPSESESSGEDSMPARAPRLEAAEEG